MGWLGFGVRRVVVTLSVVVFRADLIVRVGISYGTALGEAVAKMFPDRIERMVLDAVLDPNEYFEGR